MTKAELIDAMIDFHDRYNPFEISEAMFDQGWDRKENFMENILLYEDEFKYEYDFVKDAVDGMYEGDLKKDGEVLLKGLDEWKAKDQFKRI